MTNFCYSGFDSAEGKRPSSNLHRSFDAALLDAEPPTVVMRGNVLDSLLLLLLLLKIEHSPKNTVEKYNDVIIVVYPCDSTFLLTTRKKDL